MAPKHQAIVIGGIVGEGFFGNSLQRGRIADYCCRIHRDGVTEFAIEVVQQHWVLHGSVVIDHEMVSLAQATRTILKTLDPPQYYMSTEFRDKKLIYYLDYNLYDMNHFLMSYASEAEYNSWKQAFDKAVIYKKFASYWDTMNHVYFQYLDMTEENYGGMSMFIPQQGLQNTDNQEIKKTRWYYAAGYDEIGW